MDAKWCVRREDGKTIVEPSLASCLVNDIDVPLRVNGGWLMFSNASTAQEALDIFNKMLDAVKNKPCNDCSDKKTYCRAACDKFYDWRESALK